MRPPRQEATTAHATSNAAVPALAPRAAPLRRATRASAATSTGAASTSRTLRRCYGYQWYLGAFPAAGASGQRLYVVPDLDLVVASTAGNYNTADQATTPSTILEEVILASVER